MSEGDRAIEQDAVEPKKRKTRFLKRRLIASDKHGFIGRLYDLGIISLHFDSYDDLCRFPDCKYAVDSGDWAQNLARRVESLNLVGDLLWPSPMPKSFKEMPVSRYQWLSIAADVFLVRYVSVVDCALLLINQIFQLGLKPRSCTADKVSKSAIPKALIEHIRVMFDQQEHLRIERNARVHHGLERAFTDDDVTFKTASMFNDKLHGMTGTDRYGRKIDVDLSFREGLVSLQGDFNKHVSQLETQLDRLYDLLWGVFEDHFGPLIASATHGLNSGARQKAEP